MLELVTERETNNLEKGWYIKRGEEILSGPHTFLWQAREELERLNKKLYNIEAA